MLPLAPFSSFTGGRKLNLLVDCCPDIQLGVQSDELQLGGVYIRLLNKNPMWTLRRPREFITCLFDRIIDLTGVENITETKQMDELTVLAETGCNLLTSQSNLAKMSK